VGEGAGDPVEALGFLVGVLSAAAGTDALHGRRERRGLAWIGGRLERRLAAAGRRLVPGAALLPDAPVGLGRGWELPFALAWTLDAARGGGAGELRWAFARAGGHGRLRIGPLAAGPAVASEARVLARALRGASLGLELAAGRATWSWPTGERERAPGGGAGGAR